MEEKKSDLDPGPVLPVAQSKKETETLLYLTLFWMILLKQRQIKALKPPQDQVEFLHLKR
jgi:hypothetical protein